MATVERKKSTWVSRFEALLAKHNGKVKDDDLKKFAGRIAAERLEKATSSIRAIGTPFFGSVEYDEKNHSLPCSDKAIDYIEAELRASVESLIGDMQAGKRAVNATSSIVPI